MSAIEKRPTADPPPHPGADTDAATRARDPERGSTTGPPRWVTVVVIVIGVLVLLGVALLHLNGGLGPGLHGGR